MECNYPRRSSRISSDASAITRRYNQMHCFINNRSRHCWNVLVFGPTATETQTKNKTKNLGESVFQEVSQETVVSGTASSLAGPAPCASQIFAPQGHLVRSNCPSTQTIQLRIPIWSAEGTDIFDGRIYSNRPACEDAREIRRNSSRHTHTHT